jgi:dipeptidyl aminopeptidase/acylaminoacyl peptidase
MLPSCLHHFLPQHCLRLSLTLGAAACAAVAPYTALSADALVSASARPPSSPATGGYQLPPPALQAIVDAPRAPQLHLSPKRNLAALIQTPALPGIREVAQPELKLAGLRINPKSHAASRFSFGQDIWLLDLATQQELRISGLPANLRLADSHWSPDQRHLAFTHVTPDNGVQLWLIDVAKRNARQLSRQPLNGVHGPGFSWMPDGKALLVWHKPAKLGPPPVSDGIPSGPNVQESLPGGGNKQLRTWPDLLKNEADATLLDYYGQSQLAILDLQGQSRPVGPPELYHQARVAPNGQYLLTQSVDRPYSYVVPLRSFPQRIEIRDLSGKVLHTLAKLPLEEGLPPGSDATSKGPRRPEWRADAPASVVWAEAQDGGDPKQTATVRDIVYQLPAPFSAPPQILAKLTLRYHGMLWGKGDLALVHEGWHKTRVQKSWRIAPDQPGQAAQLLFEGSSEDHYHDPGEPVLQADGNGFSRMLMQTASDGSTSLLLHGAGAAPDGAAPFLDRYNLATRQTERLFRSSAPFYEDIAGVIAPDGSRLLTRREAPTERPNYYIRDLKQAAAAQLSALTRFPHPLPHLKDIQKEVVHYQRADGVALKATLYLPPNYDPKKDGTLPVLMWAYPHEFKSQDAAGQVTDSPYQFNALGPTSAKAFVAMGYAVFDDPSMPIVGAGDKEPNDSYLPQLIASAEAAVNEVVRRGIADRHRIAIGGHSYGGFMTGNLLAHTRLFRAGIARSGAYNRTLTPFGFQSEDRQFWQAKDVYQTMSPFNYAENIKDALLFIHGEQDNNPGTFPIQSERMFQAMKGLGGTAKLVMLPNESHGYRARESIMHTLYETNLWLEKYVKNAKP